MNSLRIIKLNDREMEISGLLDELGFARNTAMVLSCLITRPELTSSEITELTGLRQPEVSIIMNTLEKVFVARRKVRRTLGKGRPTYYYTLKIPVATIIRNLEIGVKQTTHHNDQLIANLRKLT